MTLLSRFFLLFAMMITIVACDNQQAQVEELPTLAILPSSTPTEIPSETPIPTFTPTETPSLTPTLTFTPSPTLTLTASLTYTPSKTFTPTVTGTSTLTFTPTATDTPIASSTPTLTFTPAFPVISLFQSNVPEAAPGANVTLRWSSSADTAELRQVAGGTGEVLQTYVVAPIGSQVVTLPTTGSQAFYKLIARRGGQETTFDLQVKISCSNAWFFSVTPPGGGCPNSGAVSVLGAYQPFQTGLMFMYTTANGERICGLQNEDTLYLCYADGWDGSTIKSSPSAPSGLFNPQQMFNWAWHNTLASGGTWENKIGWATNNINNNPLTVQFDQQGRLYIQTPQGIYYLSGDNVSGHWQKIQ